MGLPRLSLLLAGCLLLIFQVRFPRTLIGQNVNAELTGRITDPQGAVIAGATVKAVEQNRGTTFSSTSTSDGTYTIDGIVPGMYRLEVTMQGFEKAAVPDLDLTPLVTKRIDVSLRIGQTTQVVQVMDTAPTIQTQKPALTSIEPKQVLDHPISNDSRAWVIQTLEFFPDSAPGGGWMLFGEGQRSHQEFTLEGLAVNPFDQSLPEIAVSELQLTSNNAPAEFARPVNVDVTFRSGSNSFHGAWEETGINNCLDAVNTPFFQYDRAANGGKPSSPCTTTLYRLWRIGGPVRIPHVYDGRNKSFVNFTWHSNANKVVYVNNTAFYSVPSLQMQAGNFANYDKTIVDPITGQPFPGNTIPASRLNPVTKAWNDLAWGPGPGISYLNQTSFANNVQAKGYYGGPWTDWSLKFDQNIGQKDVLTYLQTHFYDSGWQNSPWDGFAPRTWNYSNLWVSNYSISETHTFSPAVVNQLRLGVSREHNNSVPSFGDPSGAQPPATGLAGTQWLSKLGIQGLPNAPNTPGAPIFNISGWPYNTYGANPGNTFDSIYQLYDDVTYVHGAHRFKMGWYSQNYAYDDVSSGPFWGSFNFDGRFTGDAFADFLLGYPATITSTVSRPWISRRRYELAAYFQDNWSVTPNLSLNLGLRWDTFTPPYDRNREYYNFDLNKFAIVVPDQKSLGLVSSLWPQQTLPVITASQAGLPSSLFHEHYYFEPRIGLAWRPFGGDKTVVRGGYGIYSGRILFNELQTGGPFQVTSSFPNNLVTTAGVTAPEFQFPNPFAGSGGGSAPPVSTATGYNPDFRAPVVQNGNITFEHALGGNWGLRASYMISRTTQMTWSRNVNSLMVSTIPYSQSRLPYPQWQALNFGENGGNDIYHSFQIEVSHRWASGLWLQGSYQYRYDRSDLPRDIWSLDEAAPAASYAYNRAYDRGPSGLFPTSDVVVNWVHELPVGSGKRFLSDLSRRGTGGKILNAVIGNWASSGTFTVVGGLPFDLEYTGHDPGNIDQFSGRPDMLPGCDPYAGAHNVHGLWYNPACFTIPKPGTLGNTPRDFLRTPGNWTIMFNPYKDFPIPIKSEDIRLRFGANIYNLLNHPAYNGPSGGVWGIPVNDVTSPTAGKITSTKCVRAPADWACSSVRQIMLRAEIMF